MLTKKEIIKFWRERATDDKATAKALLKSKRYSACLFFTHIYLEKTLKALVTFNIRARYDDYKSEFYKKATKDFTIKYFESANKLYLWLEKKFTPIKKQKK